MRGAVEVLVARPVRADHRRGVAAELEGDVLVRHGAPDGRADRPGAGERDHRQPRVGDQRRRRGRWAAAAPRTCPAGRSVSASSSPSSSADSGVAGRRLEDDRRADRDGRRHLVRDEVEREVERRDAKHRPRGHPADERHPAGRRGVGVEPLQLAGEAAGLLGGPAERRHRPADLGPGPLSGLPFSAVISSAISSARSAIRRDTWSSAAARTWAGSAAASAAHRRPPRPRPSSTWSGVA